MITASMIVEAKRISKRKMKEMDSQHLASPRLRKFIKAAFEAKALNDMIYEQQK